MNYTEKYHLPQWVKEDRIMMEDFNQMCRDMESGLAKTAKDAADAAEQGEAAAAMGQENAAAVVKAQSTADTALSKANAAQTTADAAYCPSFKPYVIGTYTGNGSLTEAVKVTLGFKPSFLIISAQTLSEPKGMIYNLFATGTGSEGIQLLPDGFSVLRIQGNHEFLSPDLNDLRTFSYIAVR